MARMPRSSGFRDRGALHRINRRGVDRILLLNGNRSLIVNGIAQAVYDTSQRVRADPQ